MRLLDVAPDGVPRDFMAAFGRLRARYRSTEREAAPLPLPSGEATLLKIGMGYTSNVLRAGHRLQVVIMGSVLPYVHPNVWEPFESMAQARPATNTIHHDADHPSRIVLPVIPREKPTARASE
jgi:predicted acyl esterase